MRPRNFLLPLSLMVLVYGIDTVVSAYLGDQTLAPALSVLSLFVMAMVIPARWVLFWSPWFAFESYWLINDVSQFPLTRTFTVLLAGTLATWAARQREKLDDQYREIEQMLLKLPTPWILIDGQGSILKSNELGASWLGSSREEIAGNSIFSVGAPNEESRKIRINDFVRLGKGSILDQGIDFPLGTIHPSGKKVSAFVFSIPSPKKSTSLLVLRET